MARRDFHYFSRAATGMKDSPKDQPRRNEEHEDFSYPFFALLVSSRLIFILLNLQ